MGQRGRRVVTRLLAALGVGAAALLVAAPDRVVDRLCPELPRDRLWLVRVLGGRMLVQHAAVLVAPRRPLVRAAAAVEVVHALSVLPAVGSTRYGRAARCSAGFSAVCAAVAVVAAGRGPGDRSPGR